MKILIVDDSSFSRKITANMLISQLGQPADILLASDGKEGFFTYKEHKPDFVITDLLMPIMSGQEMIKMIKELDEAARIFALSADVQKSVREEMNQYALLAFINKPLDEEKIAQICNLIKESFNEQ